MLRSSKSGLGIALGLSLLAASQSDALAPLPPMPPTVLYVKNNQTNNTESLTPEQAKFNSYANVGFLGISAILMGGLLYYSFKKN